jgi:hypothetical protein
MINIDTPKFKYPKTWHLPWSMAHTADDKILTYREVEQHFLPIEDAYVSIKMDGECTTIGKGFSHARSLDSKDHWSRHHIKQLTANLFKDLEPGWRICGENMLAVHSIRYTDLESFFYVFSVWDDTNTRLSLDEMIEYCDFLGLTMTKIIKRSPFRGFYFGDNFKLDLIKDEGYVVSNANRFHYDDTKYNLAKMVRQNHVQTGDHWMKSSESEDFKNQLAK